MGEDKRHGCADDSGRLATTKIEVLEAQVVAQVHRMRRLLLLGSSAPKVFPAIHASDSGASILVELADRGSSKIRQGVSSFVPRDDLAPIDE